MSYIRQILGDGIAIESTAGPTDSAPGRLTEVGAKSSRVTAQGPRCVDPPEDGKNAAEPGRFCLNPTY